MKITVKEIGISGALILGSGLLIGCISALCQKKESDAQKVTGSPKTKGDTTPVVQMKIVPNNEPIKEPVKDTKMEASKQIISNEVTPKEVIKSEVVPTEVEEAPAVKQTEIKTEIALIETPEALEEVTPVTEMISDDFPLQLGSKGERVFALQKYLLKHHGWGGEVTDEFDQNLANRVLHLLKVDQIDQALFKRLMRKNKRRR
ncbi:hypothetical protein GCM10011344_41290 [Dokdonia pacifica]|uniref:Uncharacterized protein n=1 Tax=Dokdonia pacifica TaxID=1627892 RepID=A0A239ABV2_9FLAO|nr:hypothetical protein [Dokdonia pacifica]GGG36157.1 hypothetical protein GCM10011344_41290 [Dokdonia pacifica]SNR93136.1 hypothetical protein SAMN06265376_104315 [Dokdonia pacifica]